MSVGAFLGPERQASSLVRRAETRIGAFEVPDTARAGSVTHATLYTPWVCTTLQRENAEGSTYKTVGGLTTSYLYDGLALVSETVGGGGGSTSYFVHGAGIDEPLAMSRAGVVSYFAVDSLGSITATTDATGTVTHAVAFDAWGSEKASTGTRIHPFTYTGREVGEAGSLFYRARYYAPGVGRFGAEDPLRYLEGPSFYSYVKNRPTIATDPSGLITIPGLGWVDTGESQGQQALDQYAATLSDGNASAEDVTAALGGFFSALWTDSTSDHTFQAFLLALGFRGMFKPIGSPTEWSHWIPRRYCTRGVPAFGNRRLPKWLVENLFNGNYVSPMKHILSDPQRYQFISKWAKLILQMDGPVVRQWARLPEWIKWWTVALSQSEAAKAEK